MAERSETLLSAKNETTIDEGVPSAQLSSDRLPSTRDGTPVDEISRPTPQSRGRPTLPPTRDETANDAQKPSHEIPTGDTLQPIMGETVSEEDRPSDDMLTGAESIGDLSLQDQQSPTRQPTQNENDRSQLDDELEPLVKALKLASPEELSEPMRITMKERGKEAVSAYGVVPRKRWERLTGGSKELCEGKRVGTGGFGRCVDFCVGKGKVVAKQISMSDFRIEEAVMMFRLRHKNVVAFYGLFIGKVSNYRYILMESIEGIDLDSKLLKMTGPMKWELALKIFITLLEILVYMKSEDVVHGDIKADNIMLKDGTNDVILMIDFGRAKELLQDHPDASESYAREVHAATCVFRQMIGAHDREDAPAEIYQLLHKGLHENPRPTAETLLAFANEIFTTKVVRMTNTSFAPPGVEFDPDE